MSKVQIMTGNQAAAIGAKLSGVQVVAAYPITPQSQLAEIISQYIEGGELKAEYVRVEGEHSALTVCICLYRRGQGLYRHQRQRPSLYA